MPSRIFVNRLVHVGRILVKYYKLDVLCNSNENSVKEFNIAMFVY